MLKKSEKKDLFCQVCVFTEKRWLMWYVGTIGKKKQKV